MIRLRRDRGTTLVFYALLLVAMFATATLTIDIGLARLAQSEMQTAADSAALAGLAAGDGAQAHEDAVAAVDSAFLLDPTQRPWVLALGMGPGHGGPGDSLEGSQLIEPVDFAQRPLGIANTNTQTLWTNWPEQERWGDVVTGAFGDHAANLVTLVEHSAPNDDANDYERDDFIPTAAGVTSPPSSALLVRLRRVASVQLGAQNAHDDEDGVSTTGPAHPFLFGHGAFLHASTGASYSPMRDGIQVRATAIAGLQNATAVGWPVAPSASVPGGLPGMTTFAINFDDIPGGAVTVGATFPAYEGYTLVPDPNAAARVGSRLTAAVGATSDQSGYIPVFKTLPASGEDFIVGFVAATVTASGTNVTITVLGPATGPNSSATHTSGFADLASLSAADLQAWSLAASTLSPQLQAPALVR